MRCEIVAVGSELLSFARTETNSLFLASRLLPLGFEILRKTVVSDSLAELEASLSLALGKADLVILTGGLGPTTDDVTREAVAAFLGLELKEDASILAHMEKRYSRVGLKMTGNNRRQAQVPEGARVLPNSRGTAPGLLIESGKQWIVLLPGPPRELGPMMDDQVVPLIRQHFPVVPSWVRKLKVGGEAESRVDASVEGIYRAYPDVETTILSSPGVISLFFTWRGRIEKDLADRTLDELVGRVKDRLGPAVYSEQDEDLAEALGRILRDRRDSISAAESCTGGLISKLLTDVSGSSDYFVGSVISYANSVKSGLLGVEPALLESEGAVSGPVAEAMACGVRERLGSSIGVSTTGIAGPTGGSEEKPVGTVFLGFSTEGKTISKRIWMPGDREMVRLRTSNLALDWVRRELL
jgi:nicotinamide-nucleotide amidase